MEFKYVIGTQTRRKIKAIQSNEGREYCNREMENLLKSVEVENRLTDAYIQEKVIAETKNRSLVETARCLLTQSGLPPNFSAEAFHIYNYIRYRCITKGIPEITPLKKLKGCKPTLSICERSAKRCTYSIRRPVKENPILVVSKELFSYMLRTQKNVASGYLLTRNNLPETWHHIFMTSQHNPRALCTLHGPWILNRRSVMTSQIHISQIRSISSDPQRQLICQP